jgi:hypothetical protein
MISTFDFVTLPQGGPTFDGLLLRDQYLPDFGFEVAAGENAPSVAECEARSVRLLTRAPGPCSPASGANSSAPLENRVR